MKYLPYAMPEWPSDSSKGGAVEKIQGARNFPSLAIKIFITLLR